MAAEGTVKVITNGEIAAKEVIWVKGGGRHEARPRDGDLAYLVAAVVAVVRYVEAGATLRDCASAGGHIERRERLWREQTTAQQVNTWLIISTTMQGGRDSPAAIGSRRRRLGPVEQAGPLRACPACAHNKGWSRLSQARAPTERGDNQCPPPLTCVHVRSSR